MDHQNAPAWELFVAVILTATAVLLYFNAGSASIRGAEVGAGFLPKVTAAALVAISIRNIWVARRDRAWSGWHLSGVIMPAIVVVAGFVSLVIFDQLGLLLAVYILFLFIFTLFEARFRWWNLVLAALVAVPVYGFFVGVLGIWDPGGRLVDLRWISSW